MQILYSRCCGLDVHKASISAGILVYQEGGEPEVRRRTFSTFHQGPDPAEDVVDQFASEPGGAGVHGRVWEASVQQHGIAATDAGEPPTFSRHTEVQDRSQRQPVAGSGRRMIEGIVEGRYSAELLADRARSRLREKLPSLRLALRGRVTDHHRLLLRELWGTWMRWTPRSDVWNKRS